jgi:protein-tyrosine-phosphatase
MAEALTKRFYGQQIFVDSAGLTPGMAHPLAIEALDELGIDLSRHRPKTFDDLEGQSFDLVISLSPQAQHRAMELTRYMACDVEFWNTFDPTLVEGSRETQLDAFRTVRDELQRKILARFGAPRAPVV